METTIKLSENAFHYVAGLARMSERTIDEVVEDTFEDRFEEEVKMLVKSVELSSDVEVLGLADFQMPEGPSKRLSFLLSKMQEKM